MSHANNAPNGISAPADDALADTQPGLDELERAVEELPKAADEVHAEPEQAVTRVKEAAPPVPTQSANSAQLTQYPTWQLGDWLRVSGQGLGAASTATSAGFSFARGATSLSLNIAKRLTQAAVAIPAMAIDSASGSVPTGENATVTTFAHKSVGGLFDRISTLALGGIDIGSALTTAGLGAAATGMEGVHRSLGSEVVKSAGQFVRLVQRTWNESNDSLPPGGIPGFGLTGVTRALIAWICIQMVTRADYEKQMLQELEEFDLAGLRNEIEQEQKVEREQRGGGVSQVRITSEDSGQGGDVIGAEIGRQRPTLQEPATSGSSTEEEARPLSNKAAVQGLLRYSDLVLAVYGGTALAWLGVLPKDDATPAQGPPATSRDRGTGLRDDGPVPPDGLTREQDEDQFLRAAAMMDLPEDERIETAKTLRTSHVPGGFSHSWNEAGAREVIFTADPEEDSAASSVSETPADDESITSEAPPSSDKPKYTYMTLLSGQHDEDLFHRVGRVSKEHTQAGSYDEHPGHAAPTPSQDTAAISQLCQPRYYVVTDHTTRKIVLVLRGSMTLGEIFTDLTCESRRFEFPQEKEDAARRREAAQASKMSEEGSSPIVSDDEDDQVDLVHEGMYEAACGLGAPGRPVHRAVHSALAAQPGYNLDIIGHSLGAGVASILAILWADPRTTLTTPASGLPAGRKLHAYCYACPCTMSAALGTRCANLITTYALSYDLVCRLSLGSVKDIRNACAWILYEDKQQAQAQRRPGVGATAAEEGVGFDPKDRSTPLRITTLLTRAFEHQAGRLDDTEEEEASDDGETAAQPEPVTPSSLSLASSSSSDTDDDDADTIAGESEADANADAVSLAPTFDTTFTTSTSNTTSSADTAAKMHTEAPPAPPRPSKKRQVEQDFLALRRTLEANMLNVELYPPGQIIYLFRGGDLITDAPAGAGEMPPPSSDAANNPRDPRRKVPRAFTLRAPTPGSVRKGGRVEKVFAQIQFSKGLLSTHMPHAYGQVLKAGGSDSGSG